MGGQARLGVAHFQQEAGREWGENVRGEETRKTRVGNVRVGWEKEGKEVNLPIL